MPDYALQYTFKQGPDVMINVPVTEDDPDMMATELELKLGVVHAKAERSAAVQAELLARGAVAGILGGRTISSEPTSSPPSAKASADPMAPVCECGERRKWKEGTSKAGNDYKGFFCVNNKCKPDFRK